jgi:hypothetical protein
MLLGTSEQPEKIVISHERNRPPHTLRLRLGQVLAIVAAILTGDGEVVGTYGFMAPASS